MKYKVKFLTMRRGKNTLMTEEASRDMERSDDARVPEVIKTLNQFSSVTQSCPTLCDPMNCSTPGLPVHDHLPELTQTHVHQVRDAIQSPHPRSSPSPPAPNPSQQQSLFQ